MELVTDRLIQQGDRPQPRCGAGEGGNHGGGVDVQAGGFKQAFSSNFPSDPQQGF